MKTDRTGARAWNRVADGEVVVDGPVDALAVWDGDILLIFGGVGGDDSGEGVLWEMWDPAASLGCGEGDDGDENGARDWCGRDHLHGVVGHGGRMEGWWRGGFRIGGADWAN
jgi:hypothetical protein